MISAKKLQDGLAGFYGTESYYRHRTPGARPVLLSDGTHWLAQQGFYWLMDMIALRQSKCLKDEMLRSMQFWTLKVDLEKGGAVLTCERDSDDIFLTEKIDFTDCPVDEIKLYVSPTYLKNDEVAQLIYLPSEY